MKIELFNTPSVEGRKILSYKGIVQASQVAGTGFLTDFVASLSDFFGGNSGVYRDTMNELCQDVLRQLEENAIEKSANAIVGLHIDFDNISAKGMSMFMVSAQGTAVVLDNNLAMDGKKQSSVVDNKIVEKEMFIDSIVPIIKDGVLTENQWKSIVKYADTSISEMLHTRYLTIPKDNTSRGFSNNIYVQYYMEYFSHLPFKLQVELAYKSTTELEMIKKFNLFDAKCILKAAKDGNISFAIDCLSSCKNSYKEDDLISMTELYDYLSKLPDKGQMKEVEGGMFSSGGLKYICECGTKNDKDQEFCKSCGKNIKGLDGNQVILIQNLKTRIEVLQKLLDCKTDQ